MKCESVSENGTRMNALEPTSNLVFNILRTLSGSSRKTRGVA
jgi:hypothetical protein